MKKLIITVGPSLFRTDTMLKEIDDDKNIYRINGAHGNVENIEEYINRIRCELPHATILIDLPGNKVRTANLDEPIALQKDSEFKLLPHQTNYPELYQHLRAGDTVLASDSTLRFTVARVSEKEIVFISKSEGQLHTNKGLHVKDLYRNMPFLFEKDRALIELANRYKIAYIGLSFVRTVEDVNLARELLDNSITIISKIETSAAVANLNSILKNVDFILVDRGDLSTDIGIEKIPAYQKFIIEKANFNNKNIFLATQFLKNMEEKPIPTIAEVIDMYNTLKTGVYGIQLSEETSIGNYPKECLDLIKRLMQEIDSETKGF